MSNIDLIATAAFGLESLTAQELKDLGYLEQKVENGRVNFRGDPLAISRANIWLRTAGRVLIKMGEFKALTFEELFQGTKALPWADWLPENAAFPVQGKSVNSKLFSVPDCQAIVKKAIVEKMKERYRQNWFPEDGPVYPIEVGILKDVVTLTIDTSGSGLHKRGYRKLQAAAPIRETLAAAMVLLTRWKPDRQFIDPLCGSGTIAIEAALIGQNIAPGLRRDFACNSWPNLDAALFRQAREEAGDLAHRDRQLHIIGTDIDEEVLSLARYHAGQAGVAGQIHWQRQPLAEIRSRQKYGYLVCNPPYGERLGEVQEAERLYREMGKVFKILESWSFYVLTSYPKFEELFGRKADKKRKLFNGRIECNYFQFFGPKPPRRQPEGEGTQVDHGGQAAGASLTEGETPGLGKQ